MSEKEWAGLTARPGRALVVDDLDTNREVLRYVLEEAGHLVMDVASGEEALVIAAEEPIDVILLDYMMPGLDGMEVCRRLKADPATSYIPVLMVTGHSEREDKLRAIAAGANDFLSKPIDVEEVRLRVANSVNAKHAMDDLVASYEKLQALEKLRDGLTQMLVHDLKSPLAAVCGYLDVMKLTGVGKLDSELLEMLGAARQGAVVLYEMIRSLLDISRLEAGQMPLQPKLSDLSELATAAMESVTKPGAAVRLELAPSPDPVIVTCDRGVITRVIVNLLANAVKFAPADSTVGIAVAVVGSHVQVRVSDSGPGVALEHQKRIFDRYYAVENPGQDVYSTGLGLTFCRAAVEAHRGEIGVESEPGHGATFWFKIPSIYATSAPRPRPRSLAG
jgi:two-component system sensor histidine kinase/response regulator